MRLLRGEAEVGATGLACPEASRHCKNLGDLFSDDSGSSCDGFVVHGIADANAFMAVRPIRAFEAEKEILSGNDEDPSFFQPFVELLRVDGKARQPEPEKEGTLGRVQPPRDMRRQFALEGTSCFFALSAIVGLYDGASQVEEFP